jgi:hypothetical protein
MRIDLIPGPDCMVSEIIGNLRESKTLGASETHLILVKIRLGKITSPSRHIRESSTPDELIADLEDRLGDALTPYLTVRLTYRHSGFPDEVQTAAGTETGMSAQSTILQSEATAVIQRQNPHSEWSPRTSRAMNEPINTNPLIKLIETHFSTEKALRTIEKLARERRQLPSARQSRDSSKSAGSSEETLKGRHGSSLQAGISSGVTASMVSLPNGTGGVKDAQGQEDQDADLDKDPARKIWSEMRRTSRSGRPNGSPRDRSPADDGCSTGRVTSASSVDQERNKIKQTALRNKRSMGADSLRSIAPSLEPPRGGTFTGLGLNVGRNWGWHGTWW